jgi:hypothetical protein
MPAGISGTEPPPEYASTGNIWPDPDPDLDPDLKLTHPQTEHAAALRQMAPSHLGVPIGRSPDRRVGACEPRTEMITESDVDPGRRCILPAGSVLLPVRSMHLLAGFLPAPG